MFCSWRLLYIQTFELQGEGEVREIRHYSIHGWSIVNNLSLLISMLTAVTNKIDCQMKTTGPHPVTVVYRLVTAWLSLYNIALLF